MKAAHSRPRRIHVHHENCTLIDLGAEAACGALARELSDHPTIDLSGTYPRDPEQLAIVEAIGVPRMLGVTNRPAPQFLPFPLRMGRYEPTKAGEPKSFERVGRDLALYVDKCLGVAGYSLTPEGRANLINMVTEVLGNAEEHAKRGTWWVAAYFRRQEGRPSGDCHITMFNLGPTIAATLGEMAPDSPLRAEIEGLISRHRSRGLFEPGQWDEEALWTLFALQEGVSRVYNPSDERGGRGHGTAELIDLFQTIGQEPRMCLVSGRTHILFDKRYRIRATKTKGGASPRLIAFNRRNRLDRRPDRRNVTKLSRPFPGTLISMRFILDEAYLRELTA